MLPNSWHVSIYFVQMPYIFLPNFPFLPWFVQAASGQARKGQEACRNASGREMSGDSLPVAEQYNVVLF